MNPDSDLDLSTAAQWSHHPIIPHSCEYCRRVVLRLEHFTDPTNRLMLPHTVSEIQQAAETGCDFFSLILSQSGPHHLVFCSGCTDCTGPQDWRMNKLAMLKRLVGLRKTQNHSYHWTKEAYKFRFQTRWKRGRVSLRLRTEQDWFTSLELSYHGWLEPMEIPTPGPVVIGVEGKAASEVGARIYGSYNADVASRSTLGQMRQWLMECHSSHTLCRQYYSSFVPRRLLQISPGTRTPVVRLVENWEGPQAKWAALSYVWGGEQSFKTTRASLLGMKTSFGVEKLPRTLEDAVTVCIALNLELLWVDSLCIVQDDPEDLDRELASMPQIYQRAWVTISASTSTSVLDGFLQERCYSHQQTPWSLPYLADDGLHTGDIVFTEFQARCSGREEPINDRAWTYQERRLSHNILDFRHKEVVLYCYTHNRGQGTGSSTDWSGDLRSTKEARLYKPVSVHQPLPEWREVVAGYATRQLSFPSDKLRALSALANIYKQQTGYTYLAGLWKESLVNDLCWETGGNQWCERPVEYRAPSWSWAAIDLVAPRSSGRLAPRSIYHEDINPSTHAYAKVTNITITQWPPNTTFGKIYAGSLTLEAPVLWTTWQPAFGLRLGLETALAKKDAIEAHDDSVLAVLLTRSESLRVKGSVIYRGLILNSASEGVYRRVGLFESFNTSGTGDYDSYFYALFKIRTIVII